MEVSGTLDLFTIDSLLDHIVAQTSAIPPSLSWNTLKQRWGKEEKKTE